MTPALPTRSYSDLGRQQQAGLRPAAGHLGARRQGDPGPRAAAHDREGEPGGGAAGGGGGIGRDGAAGCVVGCWILFSRLKEKHAPADGWAPGANALGCECPPASADGRRLLLDFAPKGIRTRVPTCSATHKRGTGALLSSKPVIRSEEQTS